MVKEADAGGLAAAYVLTTAVVGLAEAGIAQRLSPAWTPLAALAPNPAARDVVAGVLRYLAIRGITEQDGDRWRVTDRGRPLLHELPTALLGYYADAYGPVLHAMSGQLTGERPYAAGPHRDSAALGRHCEVLFRSFGTELVRRLAREHRAGAVLDLGCGTGGLVLDLCRDDPGRRAVGLDIAEDALAIGAERARAEGLADRVTFVAADAFRPDTWPRAAYDCDFLVAVGALHEHFRDGEDSVVELLSRYAKLMSEREHGVLLLAEPELLADPADADFFLVHVLTAQGMPRPRDRWLPLFARAGLRCHRLFSAPNTGFRFAYYELLADD